MRILITGAGLVGTHAAAELVRHGHRVALLDVHPDRRYVAAVLGPAAAPPAAMSLDTGDAADPDAVLRALHEHRAEAVVHTAGLLGAKCNDHAYLAFRVNGGGAAAVAEAARAAGVRRLIYLSSLAVYDWPAVTGTTVVDEEFPTAPRTPYGASKLAGELAVRCYQAAGWLDVTVLRLAGVYGPGHFRGGAQLGSLVQHIVARAVGGAPVTVPARLSGHEYLHAADAAGVIRLVLEGGRCGVYNVGTGRTFQAADLAGALRRAVPGAVVAAADPDPTPSGPALCVRRARRELPGWTCRDLDDGLADLAAALRAHPWLAWPAVTTKTGEGKETR